ncbi:hypothetical protein B4N89_42490 [Embleya scabrispora]|uniref:Uncharacterized protein n=1 Tax=Embleya scabrispora TaxID=159449 RepID=A0A1T3NKI1_9ACTN|nr:hypothetical protein B4N89_42490 [Embleya scabrispora]
MSRNGSMRGFVGRSLTMGSALVVAAAGQACAIAPSVTEPASAQAAAAAVRRSNSDLEVIRIDMDRRPTGERDPSAVVDRPPSMASMVVGRCPLSGAGAHRTRFESGHRGGRVAVRCRPVR